METVRQTGATSHISTPYYCLCGVGYTLPPSAETPFCEGCRSHTGGPHLELLARTYQALHGLPCPLTPPSVPSEGGGDNTQNHPPSQGKPRAKRNPPPSTRTGARKPAPGADEDEEEDRRHELRRRAVLAAASDQARQGEPLPIKFCPVVVGAGPYADTRHGAHVWDHARRTKPIGRPPRGWTAPEPALRICPGHLRHGS